MVPDALIIGIVKSGVDEDVREGRAAARKTDSGCDRRTPAVGPTRELWFQSHAREWAKTVAAREMRLLSRIPQGRDAYAAQRRSRNS